MANKENLYPATATYNVATVSGDIDFMGHVGNSIYLRWVQDATLAHWQELAPGHVASAYHWVALRHEIDYVKPAFLGDGLSIDVDFHGVRGAKAFYDARIRRGDVVLARCASVWCCIDATTRAPCRLPAAATADIEDKVRILMGRAGEPVTR